MVSKRMQFGRVYAAIHAAVRENSAQGLVMFEDGRVAAISPRDLTLSDLITVESTEDFVVTVYCKLLDLLPERGVINEGIEMIDTESLSRQEFVREVMKNELFTKRLREFPKLIAGSGSIESAP